MQWKQAIEEERAVIGRIVALLVALAGLAELAAGRSAVVRGFVLWLLRHAEAVARDFVEGGEDAPLVALPMLPAGNGPADALRLAASLRALARQLERQARLLRAPCGDDRDPDLSPCGRMPALREALAGLSRLAAIARGALPPVPAPDTS